MKKLSLRHERYLIRKAIAGNQCRNDYINQLLFRERYRKFEKPNVKIKFDMGKAVLTAPKYFDLSENAEEVLNFLSVFRRISGAGIKLYVDFTTIKSLSPMAALLLTSEIDRWRRYGKIKLRIVASDDWDVSVKKLLSEMGFIDLFQPVDRFYLHPEEGDVKYLKLQSGTFGDGTIAENLARNIARMTGSLQDARLLNKGLTEAMINSKKWAYSEDIDESERRWWITASHNKKTQTAIIMIYDHGVGIPQTIPTSGFKELYKNIIESWGISEPDDAYWIKAAMTLGRTASHLKGRGKGLRDIQQFILANDNGMLRVLSGKGEYIMDSKGEDKMKTHKTALNGTLIAWQINVGEVK